MEKRYISVVETAKLLRQSLKNAFPGVKFQVVSKTYSGGASITVNWTDGPKEQEVHAITAPMDGADFDAMQDLKIYKTCMLNGEPVCFGADFIFTNRHYSDEFLTRIMKIVIEKYGVTEFTPEDIRDAYKNGVLWEMSVKGANPDALRMWVHQELEGN